MLSDLNALLNLVDEYFHLPDGALIDQYDAGLFFCTIQSAIAEHPHGAHSVSITRRALKHMVESRRKELLKRHNYEKALSIIVSAVSAVPEVIQNFDYYELEAPDKHFYVKDFSAQGMPNLRVLLKMKDGDLFVNSIHFSRRTKKHH
jgi:hypothetical protein